MATKAIEQYLTAAATMNHYLEQSDSAEVTKQSFDVRFNIELDQFRDNVIRQLVLLTPPTFRENMEIEDWNSAMKYLESHKAEAVAFWRM